MARAMLDYTYFLLEKVSFDAQLFCKELQKAIERLLPNEVYELHIWVTQFVRDKPELQPSLRYLKEHPVLDPGTRSGAPSSVGL